MDWIVFFQNQYNRIIFISSQNPNERDSLEYYKFLQFINKEFIIKNFIELKNNIDRFNIIQLDKTGEWLIVKDIEVNATFQQMYAINGEQNEEENISPIDLKVNKSKDLLDKIFNYRRKENEFKFNNRTRR